MLHALLRGKRYRIVAKRLPRKTGGYCNAPHEVNKEIAVCSSIKRPGRLLENLLHECLHGALWDLDEEAIDETAECIARTLMRAGVTVDVDRILDKLK